jgi:hypothetical protein
VRWRVGDPVWCLFFDRDADDYVPKLVGTVSAVRRDGAMEYRGGGQTHVVSSSDTFAWKSEAEARAWIAANPRNVPGINPRVSK